MKPGDLFTLHKMLFDESLSPSQLREAYRYKGSLLSESNHRIPTQGHVFPCGKVLLFSWYGAALHETQLGPFCFKTLSMVCANKNNYACSLPQTAGGPIVFHFKREKEEMFLHSAPSPSWKSKLADFVWMCDHMGANTDTLLRYG